MSSLNGARTFTALIFIGLYLSFWVIPIQLWLEFGQQLGLADWLAITMFHSYLFVFYPLFGLAALIAFFRPAVIFTDLYWHHIKLGRVRFILGFVVAVALAIAVASILLTGQPRGVWEMSSKIPTDAHAVSFSCEATGKGCDAGPFLTPMFTVRAASRQRIGLRPYARSCKPDVLLEGPAENSKKRQCFLTNSRLIAKDCCAAQETFKKKLHASYINWTEVGKHNWSRMGVIDQGIKSSTGFWHAVTLPFKAFFIIIMIVIAGMLVVWKRKVDQLYADLVPKMDRGMVVGAIVMLFWPLMEYAYAQSAGVMFGNWEPGFNLKASIIVLPWALVVGLYFMQRHGFGVLSQVMSIIGGAFAAFQYDQVTNLAVRYFGSGAGLLELNLMIVLVIFAIVVVLWPSKTDLDTSVSSTQPTASPSDPGQPGVAPMATATPTGATPTEANPVPSRDPLERLLR